MKYETYKRLTKEQKEEYNHCFKMDHYPSVVDTRTMIFIVIGQYVALGAYVVLAEKYHIVEAIKMLGIMQFFMKFLLIFTTTYGIISIILIIIDIIKYRKFIKKCNIKE